MEVEVSNDGEGTLCDSRHASNLVVLAIIVEAKSLILEDAMLRETDSLGARVCGATKGKRN